MKEGGIVRAIEREKERERERERAILKRVDRKCAVNTEVSSYR